MFGLSESTVYYMCQHPVDMRKGINGLYKLGRSEMKMSPLTGSVFIFYGKNHQSVHNDNITWNSITIELKKDIQEQLRHNYRVAMGLPVDKSIITQIPQQQQEPHAHRPPSNYQSLSQSNNTGSTYANREHEVGNRSGMDMSVDNEKRQRSRWKR